MRATKEGSYCFSKRFGPDDEEYAVWVQPRGAGELYVPSIIPLRAGQPLSVERHNEVLEDFERTFVESLVQGLKARPISYEAPSEPSLEEVLSHEAMRRLRAFSQLANKGMLHPLDIQRWLEFIARSHVDNAVLDPSLLSDWLAGEGWPSDKRSALIEEYDFGRSLLSVYDEERAER